MLLKQKLSRNKTRGKSVRNRICEYRVLRSKAKPGHALITPALPLDLPSISEHEAYNAKRRITVDLKNDSII